MKIFKHPLNPANQLFLLPPSVMDFVPDNSAVTLMSGIVDQMDISLLLMRYKGGGAPSYHPRMLIKLLLLCYSEGIRSSRRIAASCSRDLFCMYLCEMQTPDFHTIARFRRDNFELVQQVFKETVLQCQEQGLVLLQDVSVDGSKIEANVSGKQTYNYKRALRTVEETEARIARILSEAEIIDSEEDAQEEESVNQKREDLLKREYHHKEQAEKAIELLEDGKCTSIGVTDLESRVMQTRSGNRPAYNAQIGVDANSHVIVAAKISQAVTDGGELPSMLDEIEENTGSKPLRVLADAGYSNPETLIAVEEAGVEGYIAQRPCDQTRSEFTYDPVDDKLTGRDEKTGEDIVLRFYRVRVRDKRTYRIYRNPEKHRELCMSRLPGKEMELQAKMHKRLSSSEGRDIYRLRQQSVEPVFGHIKSVYGLRKFHLRGIIGAEIEFLLACAAHNIQKLAVLNACG